MPGEFWDDLVAVLVVGLAMMVPIVSMMLKHQRKMAELYAQERMAQGVDPRLAAENDNLKKELAEMKALLYQQAIAIDDLKTKEAPSQDLRDRIENSAS